MFTIAGPVWDVLSDEEAINVAQERWNDPTAASAAVCDLAYKSGSNDNLTAAVIQFGWHDGPSNRRIMQSAVTRREDAAREVENARQAALQNELDEDIFS